MIFLRQAFIFAIFIGEIQGILYWTEWVSAEHEEAVCDGAAKGMRCKGSYCSSVSLYCDSGIVLSPYHYWTGWFSTAHKDVHCESGSILTGIKCKGSYCSQINVRCSTPSYPLSKPKYCHWSLWINGDYPNSQTVWPEEFVYGAQCYKAKKDCDSKRFYICTSPEVPMCSNPYDRVVARHSADNLESATSTSFSITKTTGTESTQSTEITHKISTELQIAFRGIGVSLATGFDWTSTSSTTFKQSTTVGFEYTCPPYKKCTLEQVVGYCGEYVVYTSQIKMATTP